jgi:hypothetical protein
VQFARVVVGLAIAVAFAGHAFAADVYVVAGAASRGDGTPTRPFSQLEQAEAASSAGDRIYVSAKSAWEVLPGSITLKPNQKLIGRSPTGGAPLFGCDAEARRTPAG